MVGQELITVRLKVQNSNGSANGSKSVMLSTDRFERVRKQLIDTANLKGDRSFYTMWVKKPDVLQLAAVAFCAPGQLDDFKSEKSQLEAKLLGQTDHNDRSKTKAKIDELERHIKALESGAPFADARIREIREELCLPPDMISIPVLDEGIFSELPDKVRGRILAHPSIWEKIERDKSRCAQNHASSEEELAEKAVQAFVEAQYEIFCKELPKNTKGVVEKFKAAMETVARLFIENKGTLSCTMVKTAFPLANVVHKGNTTSMQYASDELVVMDLSNLQDPVVVMVGNVQDVGRKYAQDHDFGTSYNSKHDRQAHVFTSLYKAVFGEKKNTE